MNGIGQFVIGESPIGNFSAFDWRETVISQYANSPVMLSMLESFSDCVNPYANIEAFFDLMFNVDTAQGYGLDVWGRIVNVSRVVSIPAGDHLGFLGPDGLTSGNSFNSAPFYAGPSSTDNYALSDDAYRTLIFAKALFNISDGSTPSINKVLTNLFPQRGACYVKDGLDMTMIYHFDFQLTQVELAVISQSGALPKPAGVGATIEQGS